MSIGIFILLNHYFCNLNNAIGIKHKKVFFVGFILVIAPYYINHIIVDFDGIGVGIYCIFLDYNSRYSLYIFEGVFCLRNKRIMDHHSFPQLHNYISYINHFLLRKYQVHVFRKLVNKKGSYTFQFLLNHLLGTHRHSQINNINHKHIPPFTFASSL